MQKSLKQTESETLATFREESPSQYFSDKGDEEYYDYVSKAEYIYTHHFKFPPKMFEGAELIDFGAGTGENTVYLSNWGATCTLVEMNDNQQAISKEVFAERANNPEKHSFVLSSIFDYSPEEPKQYDIVHCRGVLSHTAEKEKAFQKIASFLKPGGFLIFGDPNKAGGFQNMLQRYAVYSFASDRDEMVDVSETLFKEDIDRSERFIPRTRRAIIFDRWVIQSQDDPSVAQVVSWIQESGLRLYSHYPPVLTPVFGDSLHHMPKFDAHSLTNLLSIPEVIWMMQTESDSEFLQEVNSRCGQFAEDFQQITSYVENLNTESEIDAKIFSDLTKKMKISGEKLTDPWVPIRQKLDIFMSESGDFIRVVQEGDLKRVREFIENTQHLFKGACGVRHVDCIAQKPNTVER